MKQILLVLAASIFLSGLGTAEVAETYLVEAGPSNGLASKVAVDIISHNSDPFSVWLATGKGASFSYDGGTSWLTVGEPQGLPSENLSSILTVNGRIWIGSNHNELVAGELMTLSDGLSYSDDDGLTWTTINFGSSGLNIPFVIGGDRTLFDITGHHDVGFFNNRTPEEPGDNDADWLFAAAFAGGLLASQDGGTSWRRIFATNFDSIQFNLEGEAPSLRNRHFAAVADTSHGDSLYLWTGTAAGVFQHVFASPRDKLYSENISGLTLCDGQPIGNASGLFIAGNSGLSRASAAGGYLSTRFEQDGVPGAGVSAVGCIGDNLLAGGINAAGDQSTGLARSSDGGDTFTAVSGPWTTGPLRLFDEFIEMNGRFYLAMQEAGLFVSDDSGLTWQTVPVDAHFPQPRLNTAYALDIAGDTLFVGTDSGMVNLTLDGIGDIVAADHIPFVDSDSTGGRVVRIRHQMWDGPFQSHNILWSVHRPVTPVGEPMVARFGQIFDVLFDTTFDTTAPGPPPLVDTLVDTTVDTLGFAWDYFREGLEIHDLNFLSDTVFAVGENSIWLSPVGGEMTNFFSARQYTSDTLVVASLDQDTVTAMEVKGDTIIFGTRNGVAISNNRGNSFAIYRANLDTLAADLVVNHSYLTTFLGLAGDFVPALGVQYEGAEPARIWAGARPADFGTVGISVGEFNPASGGLEWQTVLTDEFAWNFEFLGDTILAATNGGLLVTALDRLDSTNTPWDTLDFVDLATGELLIDPDVPVYSVAAVDDYVWVGTDDGTVRLNRSDLTLGQQLFARVDSTTAADEVYAFPVPFSPNQGQLVDFHFTVEQADYVTLEVYDFAMNLVARPIDNVYYEAGIYPAQGSQGVTWDGYNDNGDLAAVGVYYFRVQVGSGEARWDKLAVIP